MLSSCADYSTSSQNSQTNQHVALYPPVLPYFSSQGPSQCSSISTFTVTSSPSSSQLTVHSSEARNLHESRHLFTSDDSFSFTFNSQNENKQGADHLEFPSSKPTDDITSSPKTISNTSSPSKYHVLNTPERLDPVSHRTLTRVYSSTSSSLLAATPDPSRRTRLVQVIDRGVHHPDSSFVCVFSDYFSISDQEATRLSDTNLPLRPTIVRRRQRLHKYQSAILQTKKGEKLPRSLFACTTKLKDELGVSSLTLDALTIYSRAHRFSTIPRTRKSSSVKPTLNGT